MNNSGKFNVTFESSDTSFNTGVGEREEFFNPSFGSATEIQIPGPQGPQGEQGIQGPKGDTGATGSQGPAGSDANVTAANIKSALGYEPAKQSEMAGLSKEVEKLKAGGAAASARGGTSSLSLSAGTMAQITLNTWVSRTDAGFTFSGGGIKCPYAGNVLISGNVYFNNTSGGRGIYIKKNSDEVVSTYGIVASVVGCATSGIAIIPVAAGDVLYIFGRCSVATSVQPNSGGTLLSVMYV